MMESKAVPIQFNPAVKDKAWMKGMVHGITQLCGNAGDDKAKDILCQRYFDGKINESDFDYLRKIDDYELPAKVRHIPIVRQNLNHLISQETRRGFPFKAFAIDEDSLNKRLDEKAEDYIRLITNNVQNKFVVYQAQDQMLDQKRQQIEAMMSQQPESQEQAQQQQALKETFPLIIAELDKGKKQLEREIYISKKEQEKVESYYRYEYSDFIELKANKILKYASKSTDVGIKFQTKNGFTDKLVTGKELYFVDLIDGNKFPTFKRLHPFNVYWSGDGENEWVQDGQWAAVNFKMSPSSIVDWFGQHLENKDMAIVSSYASQINYGQLKTARNTGAVFSDPGDSDLYGGTKLINGIDVWWVYWKSSRKIQVKFSPNKYLPGKFHRHFIDEGEEGDLSVNTDKGEYIETRYVDDVYEGIQIGNQVFLNLGKRKIQLRNESDLSVKLPVFGLSFNGIDNPYSLIWNTKDIQELNNLVHYHRELMLALAGVKGVVMDLAQKPDDLTEKEWLYYRKQGITFINSLQRRNGRFPSFNQFQTYDDTLSPSIQYLDNILVGLQRLVDEITGVSYQRKGQTVATDQVGTTASSINQSMLTTEVLFYEHDETVRRALEEWMNLAKVSLEEGHILSYDDNNGREVTTIPEYIFKSKRFQMGIETTSSQERDMGELRQISMEAYARGQLQLDQLVKLYNVDSLKELEMMVISYAEKAAKNAELYEMNKIKAENEAQMEKIKFEKEYDAQVKGQEMQLKQVELQMKQAELELKNRELLLKEYVDKTDLDLKDKEIATEREVEMTYLAEENRASRVDELLRMIELRMDAYFNEKQIDLGHFEKMKEINVKEKQANKSSKEKIKN